MAGFYLIDHHRGLLSLEREELLREAELHALLERHPQLLTGVPGSELPEEPYLLVKSEFAIADSEAGQDRWSLDIMLLARDGTPTMVEVKRAGDARLRREVVAQMLDYAANGMNAMTAESLRAAFETSRDGAADDLAGFLGGDAASDDFWMRVREKLDARDLRLIFAANRIPSELRTIVEFLNEQMSTVEVLAVEVRQYVSGDLRMVSSELVGDTARAAQRKGSTPVGPRWTEDAFFEAVRARVGGGAAGLQADLLHWAREHGCPVGAGRQPHGGLHLRVPSCPPETLLSLGADGRIAFAFPSIAGAIGREIGDIRNEVASIPGLRLSPAEKYPSADVLDLADDGRMSALKRILENWVALDRERNQGSG
ncbi:hypothetical protein [Minwuia thermotolerans]|nr:hypothetical protein [Minwuia thermotolerans]